MLPRDQRELPEGRLCCDRVGPDGDVTYSLTGHTLREMERHRWILSEQKGHNCGGAADELWLERCWPGWIRACLLEHLFGLRRWSAFAAEHFGLFKRHTVEHAVPAHILNEVAEILQRGGENLDVIAWAGDSSQDLELVLWLLDKIDINAVRHRLLTDHIRLFIQPVSNPPRQP